MKPKLSYVALRGSSEHLDFGLVGSGRFHLDNELD